MHVHVLVAGDVAATGAHRVLGEEPHDRVQVVRGRPAQQDLALAGREADGEHQAVDHAPTISTLRSHSPSASFQSAACGLVVATWFFS